ncbi:AAA family ATPase [Rhizobium sp. SG570]|uniref:AAA family ATPase n=1 Tax=Rhizobium sp. SG570 TaxID=2587113 RepID=UPI0017DF4958|nr:AAA family ATPase [Rhizobium sp. SG570]NKJ38732.1 SpoVK/Ycf46/Vps4 family AAA+-type ATPase [Rhizobium sp. SG570]
MTTKKNRRFPKTYIDPYGDEESDALSLPTHLAVITMSRVLRHFLKKRSGFVVAFALPPGGNFNAYQRAARFLLEGTLPLSKVEGYNYVVPVLDETDVDEGFMEFRKLKRLRRAIILVADKKLLANEIRLAADVVAELPPPSADDHRIAARNMGFGNLTDEDAALLASQPPIHAAIAVRHGRPLPAALRRLRLYPNTGVSTDVPSGPTLQELSGYGDAKSWGLELSDDVEAWRDGKITWDDIDRGILLYGPPGSGKTSFGSALARTCGAKFVYASAAQWQSSGSGYLGDMLTAMRKSFADAEAAKPSILLIDELDSIGSRTEDAGRNSSYARQVINGLLELLDGGQARDGVIVIGATNYPHLIDAALLRSGRLERHFEIGLPDEETRAGIFRFYLGDRLSDEEIRIVASASEGWSGADIEKGVRQARRSARRHGREIIISDVKEALPPTRKIPMAMQRQIAAHELGHAIVGVLVEADPLISVSISETCREDGQVQSLGRAKFRERMFNRKTSTYFLDKIAILLGGIAAEELLFGDFGSGAAGHPVADLNLATELATMMEIKWGFGGSLAVELAGSPKELETLRTKRKGLHRIVDNTLKTQFQRAKALLEENRAALIELHGRLVRDRELSAETIRDTIAMNRERDLKCLLQH